MNSPVYLRNEHSPAHSLALAHGDPFQTSGIQNCKIINLCRFKPPSLWQFVTGATEHLGKGITIQEAVNKYL